MERMNCIKLCSGCGDQTVDSSQTMSYWSVVSASNFLRNILCTVHSDLMNKAVSTEFNFIFVRIVLDFIFI